MAPKRKSASAVSTAKRRKTAPSSRSVWTAPDDWDTLVSESLLSTSSVSLRRPRPDGLLSLARCAQLTASRNFKRLWEEGDGSGVWWKPDWEWTDDRLKDGVREDIYTMWGGFLSADILREVFLYPPHFYLPGNRLPAVASTSLLKPFRPLETQWSHFTRLTLKHVPKATDVAIAGLIHVLPNLEEVNLKGCTLAGAKTVKTIVSRLPRLSRLNLKQTNVQERDVGLLLDTFGQQLRGFKIDNVRFKDQDLSAAFATRPFRKITHLCLPGDILSKETSGLNRKMARQPGGLFVRRARPVPASSFFRWERFFEFFPAVTHLSLPGWTLSDADRLQDNCRQLVKFVTGADGVSLPHHIANDVISRHSNTLEKLQLEHVGKSWGTSLAMREMFARCHRLRDLRIHSTQVDGMLDYEERKYLTCDMQRIYVAVLIDNTIQLERLSLAFPQKPDRTTQHGLNEGPGQQIPTLKVLEVANMPMPDTAAFARQCAKYPNLRELDLSGTAVTNEDMYTILDHCPKLHRVDLTSCRGVNVRDRRNIFEAHRLARLGQGPQHHDA